MRTRNKIPTHQFEKRDKLKRLIHELLALLERHDYQLARDIHDILAEMYVDCYGGKKSA